MTEENVKEKGVTEKKVLLKDLQNKLPIEVKGKKNQFFTFIDWTMDEEKKISKLKAKNPSMGRFVTSVLSLMIHEIHGEEFHKLEDSQRKLVINQLPLGDVLYMYVFLRYDQMGNDIKMVFECPFCGNKIENFTAQLDDLDVDCKVGDYDEDVTYKLRKPITLDKGEQLVETLKIGVAKWDSMEKADTQESADEGTMKAHTFKYSIIGVDGIDEFVSSDEIIKKMKKIDIEMLQQLISKHNAGPTIEAEIECPKCSNTFFRAIEWGYDNFFGIGSLPQQ